MTHTLIPVKHFDATTPQTEHLTNISWNVLNVALYGHVVVSHKELLRTKQVIKRFLVSAVNPYRGYLEFSQRVLLFRSRMLQDPASTYCSLPSIWLNPNYAEGFNATEDEYVALMCIRRQHPLERIELRATAEAILEVSEHPTVEGFQYWKQWFVDRSLLDEFFLLSDAILPLLLKP